MTKHVQDVQKNRTIANTKLLCIYLYNNHSYVAITKHLNANLPKRAFKLL